MLQLGSVGALDASPLVPIHHHQYLLVQLTSLGRLNKSIRMERGGVKFDNEKFCSTNIKPSFAFDIVQKRKKNPTNKGLLKIRASEGEELILPVTMI